MLPYHSKQFYLDKIASALIAILLILLQILIVH